MSNYYKEVDGEILPAYDGVNQPRYTRRDEEMPHDFSMLESGHAEEATAGPYVPPEHRNFEENLPNPEERAIGLRGVQAAREALRNRRGQ